MITVVTRPTPSSAAIWVAELLAVEKLDGRSRRQKAAEKLVAYFAKHAGRLNYRELLASGRGVVEGQAMTLGLRLKARGAR